MSQAKYDVYGIGNALVDMGFEVDLEYLQNAGIEKGVMTLVDESRQTELLKSFQGNEKEKSCGGSAANSIIAVSQLGGKTFYSCKVGNDELGDFYAKDLQNQGVQNNMISNRPEGITGKCMVFVTPDADRTMNTFLGITGQFSHQELVEEEIKQSKYLYIEGYLVASPTAKGAAIKAREIAQANSVKVAITFSDPNMVSLFKAGLNQIIGTKVDLVFCNEFEAMTYTETESVDEAFEKMKEVASTFAITLGERGALIFDGDKKMLIPPRSVDAIDTNGAGDIFAGSFLYALTHGYSFKKAGELACYTASELVKNFGPRLGKAEMVEMRDKLLS